MGIAYAKYKTVCCGLTQWGAEHQTDAHSLPAQWDKESH